MDKIKEILNQFQNKALTAEQTENQLKELIAGQLDHSTIDLQRKKRTGFPEVIFAEGKTSQQLLDIVGAP